MWIVRQPVPGALHHVIIQFIDRDFLVNDDRLRGRYVQLLGRAMAESDWRCWAFAVMSNHIHLAMLAGETPAERWTRRVHPPFAASLNKDLGRIGQVIASTDFWTVRPDRELRLIAYIHNNPVRAGVVARAAESTWTSHRAYVGELDIPWLASAHALGRLRLSAQELAAAVDADVGYKPDHGELNDVRTGARRFAPVEVATPTSGPVTTAPLVARQATHFRPHPLRVLEVVGEVIGVPLADMRGRGARSTRARAIALQSGRALGLSLASIAGALGISAQAGSRHGLRRLGEDDAAAARVVVRRIEDDIAEFIRQQAGQKRCES